MLKMPSLATLTSVGDSQGSDSLFPPRNKGNVLKMLGTKATERMSSRLSCQSNKAYISMDLRSGFYHVKQIHLCWICCGNFDNSPTASNIRMIVYSKSSRTQSPNTYSCSENQQTPPSLLGILLISSDPLLLRKMLRLFRLSPLESKRRLSDDTTLDVRLKGLFRPSCFS